MLFTTRRNCYFVSLWNLWHFRFDVNGCFTYNTDRPFRTNVVSHYSASSICQNWGIRVVIPTLTFSILQTRSELWARNHHNISPRQITFTFSHSFSSIADGGIISSNWWWIEDTIGHLRETGSTQSESIRDSDCDVAETSQWRRSVSSGAVGPRSVRLWTSELRISRGVCCCRYFFCCLKSHQLSADAVWPLKSSFPTPSEASENVY